MLPRAIPGTVSFPRAKRSLERSHSGELWSVLRRCTQSQADRCTALPAPEPVPHEARPDRSCLPAQVPPPAGRQPVAVAAEACSGRLPPSLCCLVCMLSIPYSHLPFILFTYNKFYLERKENHFSSKVFHWLFFLFFCPFQVKDTFILRAFTAQHLSLSLSSRTSRR